MVYSGRMFITLPCVFFVFSTFCWLFVGGETEPMTVVARPTFLGRRHPFLLRVLFACKSRSMVCTVPTAEEGVMRVRYACGFLRRTMTRSTVCCLLSVFVAYCQLCRREVGHSDVCAPNGSFDCVGPSPVVFVSPFVAIRFRVQPESFSGTPLEFIRFIVVSCVSK